MRTEMRTKVETVNYKVYIADDDKVFTTVEECEKYEGSARFKATKKFKELEKQTSLYANSDDPFVYFDGDQHIMAIRIRNPDDVNTVNEYISSRGYFEYGDQGYLTQDTIGTIQLIAFYEDSYSLLGTPDEVKNWFARGVDRWCDNLTVNPEEEIAL